MLQRLLTYIAGLILFVIAALVAAPVFIDLGKYKSDFAAVIKNFTGASPEIEGNIQVTFLPIPSITVGSISVPNITGASSASILVADGVEAKFTFASLLQGKFDPSSITLIRPRLELEQAENGDKNWIKLFENNKKFGVSEVLNSPLDIIIKNGSITYRSGSIKNSVDNISSHIKIHSSQGPFDLQGTFLFAATTINFSVEMGMLNESSVTKLNISSDFFDFAMQGNYRPGSNFDVRGDVSLNVKDVGKFVDALLRDEPLFSQIKSNEKLAVKGEFLISNEIAGFNKLTVDSQSVKGGGNIEMLYGAGKEGGVQWDISMNIDKIDIDSLRLDADKEKSQNVDLVNPYTSGAGGINIAAYHFDIPTDLSALFSLSVGKIIYNNDKISNLLIDTDIFNGKAIIHSFSAQLPGNSKIELIGNVDHNGTRPLLTGKIKAYGDNFRTALIWLDPSYAFVPENELKEFLLSCDLNVTPRKMTIANIYGSVDKSLLNGSLFIRPSDNIPSIRADIKLDRLDVDRYNATEQIDNYVSDFITNAKDTNIDTSWLKLFNYKLSLSIGGDEMVYNGNNIKNFSTVVGVVKGLMNIQAISIDSELVKLRGKISVDFNKEIPLINVDINSKYFDSSAFILNNKQELQSQPSEAAANDPNANINIWSSKEFNLLGVDRFGGNLNLVFDELKHNSLTLQNIGISGELKNDIFAINEFKTGFGKNGIVVIKGSLGVSKEAPSVGVSVTASAIDIQEMLGALGSANQTTGLLYVNGVLKTFGVTPADWIKELKTTAKFAMRDVQVHGIDIPMIIDQSRKLYSVIDMDAVIKNALKDSKTTFTSIDGNLTTDRSFLLASDVMLATEKSRGAFAAKLNLLNLKMEGSAKVSYMAEAAKKVTLNFNLDGYVPDSVSFKLDSSNLEQYITGKANR